MFLRPSPGAEGEVLGTKLMFLCPRRISKTCTETKSPHAEFFQASELIPTILIYLHATLLHSCHGVFIGRFTFRSNFPGIRLSWECHDQSQETNGAGATFLSRKKRYAKNRSVCKNGSCMLLLIGFWW